MDETSREQLPPPRGGEISECKKRSVRGIYYDAKLFFVVVFYQQLYLMFDVQLLRRNVSCCVIDGLRRSWNS